MDYMASILQQLRFCRWVSDATAGKGSTLISWRHLFDPSQSVDSISNWAVRAVRGVLARAGAKADARRDARRDSVLGDGRTMRRAGS